MSYKRHITQTIKLSLPLIISQITVVAMTFVDTVMAGRLGSITLAAVARASLQRDDPELLLRRIGRRAGQRKRRYHRIDIRHEFALRALLPRGHRIVQLIFGLLTRHAELRTFLSARVVVANFGQKELAHGQPQRRQLRRSRRFGFAGIGLLWPAQHCTQRQGGRDHTHRSRS